MTNKFEKNGIDEMLYDKNIKKYETIEKIIKKALELKKKKDSDPCLKDTYQIIEKAFIEVLKDEKK